MLHRNRGRALVLGGGGITGIAWELGMIACLAEHGVDLSSAGLVVGTSAGSAVGNWHGRSVIRPIRFSRCSARVFSGAGASNDQQPAVWRLSDRAGVCIAERFPLSIRERLQGSGDGVDVVERTPVGIEENSGGSASDADSSSTISSES